MTFSDHQARPSGTRPWDSGEVFRPPRAANPPYCGFQARVLYDLFRVHTSKSRALPFINSPTSATLLKSSQRTAGQTRFSPKGSKGISLRFFGPFRPCPSLSGCIPVPTTVGYGLDLISVFIWGAGGLPRWLSMEACQARSPPQVTLHVPPSLPPSSTTPAPAFDDGPSLGTLLPIRLHGKSVSTVSPAPLQRPSKPRSLSPPSLHVTSRIWVMVLPRYGVVSKCMHAFSQLITVARRLVGPPTVSAHTRRDSTRFDSTRLASPLASPRHGCVAPTPLFPHRGTAGRPLRPPDPSDPRSPTRRTVLPGPHRGFPVSSSFSIVTAGLSLRSRPITSAAVPTRRTRRLDDDC